MYSEFKAQNSPTFTVRKRLNDQHNIPNPSLAADGFNIICNYYPGPFDDFTNLVIPELQRRGIFRTRYEGTTLRDSLGLAVPRNRYAR